MKVHLVYRFIRHLPDELGAEFVKFFRYSQINLGDESAHENAPSMYVHQHLLTYLRRRRDPGQKKFEEHPTAERLQLVALVSAFRLTTRSLCARPQPELPLLPHFRRKFPRGTGIG